MTSAYLPRAGISLWNPKHPPPSPFPLPCSDQWRHPRSERLQDHHRTSFSTGIFTCDPQLLLPPPDSGRAARGSPPRTARAALRSSPTPRRCLSALGFPFLQNGKRNLSRCTSFWMGKKKKKKIKIWTHVLNKVSGRFWNVPEKPDGRAREGRLPLLLASPARPCPLPAADPPAALRCGPAAARPGTASERSGALSPRPCAPPRRAPPCPARGIPQHAAPLGEMAN